MALTRRDLMLALGGAAAASGTPARSRIVNAGYLWERRLGQQKKSLSSGLEEIFSTTAAAGFSQMELTWNFLQPSIAGTVGSLTRQHGLQVPIFYYWAALHEAELAKASIDGIEAIAGTAKSLSAKILDLSVAWKAGRERKTDAEMAAEANHVNEIAAKMSRQGFRTVLHNHDIEMVEDAREWRYLMRHTDPKTVGANLDIDWIFRGGADTGEIIGELAGRIDMVHLRNSSGKNWTQELSEGDYDWPRVAAQLRRVHFDGYMVLELIHEPGMTEVTRPALENLRRSRAYMEKTFLGR